MEVFNTLKQKFWSPDIWLIPGITWEDLAPTPENGLPNSADLMPMMIILTGGFLVLRYLILEPFVMKPFGRAIGVKEHIIRQPPYSREMEDVFRKNHNKVPQSEIEKLSQKIGWSERQIERWLRHRTAAEKPSKMFKLCDCCWNLIYYIFYCIFGMYVLYDKPWFWDIKLCWINYPFQSVPYDVWWYYMISLGYYTTMSFTFMLQVQRKDSPQMLLHHIVTIILIVLSFSVNMIRMGCLILLVHECADIPLLIAKICGYAGHNSAMDFMFVVFVLLWIATRLVIYPIWIIKFALFEVHILLNAWSSPIYFIFNGLLLALLTFHVVWTFLIIQIIVKKLKTKETRDVRSDSDATSNESEEKPFVPTTENHYTKKED